MWNWFQIMPEADPTLRTDDIIALRQIKTHYQRDRKTRLSLGKFVLEVPLSAVKISETLNVLYGERYIRFRDYQNRRFGPISSDYTLRRLHEETQLACNQDRRSNSGQFSSEFLAEKLYSCLPCSHRPPVGSAIISLTAKGKAFDDMPRHPPPIAPRLGLSRFADAYL